MNNIEFIKLSSENIQTLMPYLIVLGGIVLSLFAIFLKGIEQKLPIFIISIATLLVAAYFSLGLTDQPSQFLFAGLMTADSYSHYFNLIYLLSAAFTLMVSFQYLDREKLQFAEYYLLVLFSALGMMLMSSSQDLIVFFIALEMMSLSVYALVGFRRSDRRANEAAMKYFIMGAIASAILLYGTALLYGATGSTELSVILQGLKSSSTLVTPLYTIGLWLVVLGFLFKVASVPMHLWMPDVYEGAPTPITSFMTTGVKAASFAAFLRVFLLLGYGQENLGRLQVQLHDLIWVLAAATMLVGNVVALTQTNLKRMLAYSSIAHTGYLLIGLLTGVKSDFGYSSLGFYLMTYSIMSMGAFAVLTVISNKGDTELNLHHLSGLSRKHPWLSFALAVFIFSMAGIPPTAGFIAKYNLLYGAVQAGEIPLVIVAVLCSAISLYYYLRVLVYLYMKDPSAEDQGRIKKQSGYWISVAIALMLVLTLYTGIVPTKLESVTRVAFQQFQIK